MSEPSSQSSSIPLSNGFELKGGRMKKIQVIILILVIMLLVLFTFMLGKRYLHDDESSATIVEAIEKVRGDGYVSYFIHEVPFKDGTVVFFLRYMKNNQPQLASEYVKRTRKGWKWGFGGAHSGSNLSLNLTDAEASKLTFTEQYFPSTEGTMFGKSPFPMLFGAILNGKITTLSVKDHRTGLEKQAEIVEVNDNFKLYYVFLDQRQGTKFDIMGKDGSGKILAQQTIDESNRSSGSAGTTEIQEGTQTDETHVID
jgi:hypothetical protein